MKGSAVIFLYLLNCVLYIYCKISIVFGQLICGILVWQPGLNPSSFAVKAQSPNHWNAREFPQSFKHMDSRALLHKY